ncbi:MAG: hypothetical protein JWN12_860 [Candidatus Saccharibacteria bacterium]|nr:hypothetical protein [Candidatus Saccharibacteria bacterium]
MTISTQPKKTERSRQDRILDYSFLVGIGLKILNIIGDVLVGIPLLFISPAQVNSVTQLLTTGELIENQNDTISNFIVKATTGLDTGTLVYLGIYFLIHGAVKIGIVAALVRGSSHVYPWAIGALCALLVYQIVDIIIKFSLPIAVLSALDLVIIWLTFREWRHNRTLRDVLEIYAPKMVTKWPFKHTIVSE